MPSRSAAREDVDRLSSHTLKYSVFLAFLSLKCLNPHPNRFPEAVLDCGLGGMGRAGVRLWNLVAQSPGTAKQQFRRELQKELTGKENEASELVYFKLYNSEIPVRPLRILLAEDNAINQKVIDALLRRQGWTVVLAGNGKLACDAFECQRFDAILMDVQMPEMDGLEATGWIRQRERECTCSCRVPIVALTAHASRAQHDQCIAAGMDGVVTKPVNLPALLACIAEVLTRHGANA